MGKGNSTTDNFFAVQKEKSRVKTLIVTEFFKSIFSDNQRNISAGYLVY